MEKLRNVSSLLDNYWLRSHIFRTVQFSSALLSGLLERPCPQWSNKLMKVSASISNMRVMLRFLDDIPNLAYALNTWTTTQDASLPEKVVESVCGQLYYPVEHVAWAADNHFLPLNSVHLWIVADLLWGIPLVLTLLRQLAQLITFHKQATTDSSPTYNSIRWQMALLYLDMLQVLCDLVLAIFWMPRGFLWGGKLPAAVWGAVGTLSSLIGLYKTITSKIDS